MILRGMRTAAKANALTTVAKVVPLLLFIGLVIAGFSKDTFMVDFWGTPALGSTLDQVKSTMLMTVWVFIGIEGANVFSARAADRADVGRAPSLHAAQRPALCPRFADLPQRPMG
ncbi:Amino acid permease [Pseudomonas sp. NFACC45]|nr:Amino acid permease [Pseudomonas sp. NFACC45]